MVDLSDHKSIKALNIGFESWTALSLVEQLFVFALCNCVWIKSATSNLVKLGSSPQGLCALSLAALAGLWTVLHLRRTQGK